MNCEFINDALMIQSLGGKVWLLGYKTEGQQVISEGKSGKLELLGGLAYALGRSNEKYDRDPMFRLDGTEAAITINGNGSEWTTVIDQKRGDDLTSKDTPHRGRASKILL